MADCFAERCELDPVEEQMVIDPSTGAEYGIQPLCSEHAEMNGQETLARHEGDKNDG